MVFDIVHSVDSLIEKDSSLAFPIAAIQALVQSVKQGNATTYQELMKNLKDSAALLKSHGDFRIALQAGCDLFIRYVTLNFIPDQQTKYYFIN